VRKTWLSGMSPVAALFASDEVDFDEPHPATAATRQRATAARPRGELMDRAFPQTP